MSLYGATLSFTMKKVPLMAHVEPEVKKLAEERAAKEGRSLSNFISLLIEKALKRDKQEG